MPAGEADEEFGDEDGPTGHRDRDGDGEEDEEFGDDDPTGYREGEEEEEFDEDDPTDYAVNTGDSVDISAVWALLLTSAGAIVMLGRSLRRKRGQEGE